MSKTRNQRRVERAKTALAAVAILGMWAVVGWMMLRSLDCEAEQHISGKEYMAEIAKYAPAKAFPTVDEFPELVEIPDPAPMYDVPLDADVQAHIKLTCEEYRIDPYIVLAMIWQESGFNADAVGDSGNSLGLMQIQPRWHSGRMERLDCEDLLDPHQNVTVGIDYLAESIDRYDGDVDKALVAYNQGHFNGTVTEYAKNVLAKADELRGEN